MEDNKFKLIDSKSKEEVNLSDWKQEIKNDKLFVSVWKK